MLRPLVKVLEALLYDLPTVGMGERRRRALGRTLLELHRDLMRLLENGEELLSLTDTTDHSSGVEHLLQEHEQLLSRINKRLELNRSTNAVLAVHRVHAEGLNALSNGMHVQAEVLDERFMTEGREAFRRIGDLTRELRQFIVRNFDLADVIG